MALDVKPFQRLRTYLPPLVLGAGLSTVYLLTLAPDLTWANGGSDGGDLITAAALGGVAHPTGYPVYLLLARLFQWLPVGSLAYRTNLLSAASTVAAALLVYGILHRSLKALSPGAGTWGGLIGGLALGLAPLVWSQAVITEVYALNLFFIALLLYLLTLPPPVSQNRSRLIGLIQGLAMGNQILAVLMLPAVLLSVSFRRMNGVRTGLLRGWRFEFRPLLNICLGLLIGLLPYAILPLRAADHPPVNWGDPVTPGRFLWLITGRLYQNQFFSFDLRQVWIHLGAWAGLTLEQFGLAGLMLALLGLIIFFENSRLSWLTLWTAIAFTGFALQYQVVDFHVYLLPVYLGFSIWFGLGVGRVIWFLTGHRPWLGRVAGVCCLGYVFFSCAGNWPRMDASHDWRAENFGANVMTSAPAHAILFAEGDEAVFSLWYFHYALHQRPDLVVISDDLLPFDWYREGLRFTYPDLSIPEMSLDPWMAGIEKANINNPICFSYPSRIITCR